MRVPIAIQAGVEIQESSCVHVNMFPLGHNIRSLSGCLAAIFPVRAGADSELLLESRCEPASPYLLVVVVVLRVLVGFFSDTTKCGQSFFHTGVAHPSRVQRPVEIVGEAVMRALMRAIRGRLVVSLRRRFRRLVAFARFMLPLGLCGMKVDSTSR